MAVGKKFLAMLRQGVRNIREMGEEEGLFQNRHRRRGSRHVPAHVDASTPTLRITNSMNVVTSDILHKNLLWALSRRPTLHQDPLLP